MKEWLLKEEKTKVGRPKLADDNILKKAKVLIFFCSFVCIIMILMFICMVKEISPLKYVYSLTFEKFIGTSNFSEGFIFDDYYDLNKDYIMTLKPSEIVKSYQGDYKYILYKLNGSNWKKVEEKIFDKKTKIIKLKVNSKKNKNETYKINVYLLNASKIEKSFAPKQWEFVDSTKQNAKYAYRIFTVKGYYSPVTKTEEKEAMKKKNSKVTVLTSKKNEREFSVNVPNINYNVKITYTDETGKIITLSQKKDLYGITKYVIPNVNKISNVKINIWIKDAEKYKLSNWKLKKDKKGNSYITNTYYLKPELSY